MRDAIQGRSAEPSRCHPRDVHAAALRERSPALAGRHRRGVNVE